MWLVIVLGIVFFSLYFGLMCIWWLFLVIISSMLLFMFLWLICYCLNMCWVYCLIDLGWVLGIIRICNWLFLCCCRVSVWVLSVCVCVVFRVLVVFIIGEVNGGIVVCWVYVVGVRYRVSSSRKCSRCVVMGLVCWLWGLWCGCWCWSGCLWIEFDCRWLGNLCFVFDGEVWFGCIVEDFGCDYLWELVDEGVVVLYYLDVVVVCYGDVVFCVF